MHPLMKFFKLCCFLFSQKTLQHENIIHNEIHGGSLLERLDTAQMLSTENS